MKSKKIISAIVVIVTMLEICLGAIGVFAIVDMHKIFGVVTLEQIMFNLLQPMTGVQDGVVNSVLWAIGWKVLLFLCIYFIIICIVNKVIKEHLRLRMKLFGLSICTILILFLGLKIDDRYLIIEYVNMMNEENGFIEEYYVSGNAVDIAVPEEKRNLIYIFSESLEATFLSKEVGGAEEISLMPHLEELALEHITFSDDKKLKGPYQVEGTGWTAAGIMAQTSGMPLKLPIEQNSYGTDGVFAPGVLTLGEVLEDSGYKNYFRMGSDATFAGRDVYLGTNGNYEIYDHKYAQEKGEIPEDYRVWWGHEDEKLFTQAKQDLEKISASSELFNYTLLTVDTHFPNGYACRICDDQDDRQYANVIMCQDRQIYDFIQWIQQQDFYENTTIVVAGDHLTMDTAYFETVDSDIDRSTYFTIINGVGEKKSELPREYTTLDIYPTTLASIGISIEGERIGLGTNLYSEVPTLLEELGREKMDQELKGYSSFYNEEILGMKKSK